VLVGAIVPRVAVSPEPVTLGSLSITQQAHNMAVFLVLDGECVLCESDNAV